MINGLHHKEIRKRIYRNLETYPHTNPFKNLLDKLVFLVGVFGPIFTIPQIYTIYSTKNSGGVSGLSWSFYFVSSLIWLIYGITHKEKALILTNILWIIINAVILLGIFIY